MNQPVPLVETNALLRIIRSIDFQSRTPPKYFQDGQDFYLLMLADAAEPTAGLTYDVLRARLAEQDQVVQQARMMTKGLVFLYAARAQYCPETTTHHAN